MWERKKEKRKMFKEKNENEERKVFEGKIRFQKQKKSNFSAFLLPDCFSDKSISKVLLLFKHRTTNTLE